MSITTTIPTIDAYGGTIPDRSAGQTPEQFASNVYTFLQFYNDSFITDTLAYSTAMNSFKTEANALETNVNSKEANAVAAAAAAFLTANVTVWVSGTTYAIGDNVLSPINFKTYVRKTNGAGTTDPSADSTNYDLKIAPDTTKLPLTGGSLTGALNTAKVSVASSATTSNIWTGGNLIDFTGTATVTAFPTAPQAGARRELVCAGACSFTAGTNMLINGVTSGQTVTCAVGDIIEVIAITTTQFRLNRVKADGTAQAGGATFATTTEVGVGTESSKSIAPNALLGAIGVSNYMQTTDQTITTAGALTIAHGLGRTPILFNTFLKCVVAADGYSVNDITPVNPASSTTNNNGMAITADATNIYVRYGSGANVFRINDKTTGAVVPITNANYKMFIRVWA